MQWVVFVTLMFFPVVFFTVPRAGNSSFFLLLLCSLIGVICRIKPMGKSLYEFFREYWPVSVAMAGLVLAELIHQVSTGHFLSRSYDVPARLACFAVLCWVMLLVPVKHLKRIQWSWAAGAIVCAIALFMATTVEIPRPVFVLGVPLNPFGNIAILMGVLALLSIGWYTSHQKMAIAIKLIAIGVALYGSYLSQTRGGWVALPVFAIIAIAVFGHLHIRHKLVLLLFAMALIGGSCFFGNAIQQRVAEASSDIHQYFAGKEKNTSVGIRLQLWQGGWLLFRENPAGIGRENYPKAAQQLAKRNVLTPDAAIQPHLHNDMLFQLATQGISGLLAMLLLYFVPAFYFYKDIRNPDKETRTTAGMGLALTLGFFVFGLTDAMFYWRVSFTFYVILLAQLFACLIKQKSAAANSRG